MKLYKYKICICHMFHRKMMEEGQNGLGKEVVQSWWFPVMWNSIFPPARLLSGAIMGTVFVWWQGNRPALFRLVSAIMKKHHQPRREAQRGVFGDTAQIITIDCYLGTRKKTVKERAKEDGQAERRRGSCINFAFLHLSPISSLKCD